MMTLKTNSMVTIPQLQPWLHWLTLTYLSLINGADLLALDEFDGTNISDFTLHTSYMPSYTSSPILPHNLHHHLPIYGGSTWSMDTANASLSTSLPSSITYIDYLHRSKSPSSPFVDYGVSNHIHTSLPTFIHCSTHKSTDYYKYSPVIKPRGAGLQNRGAVIRCNLYRGFVIQYEACSRVMDYKSRGIRDYNGLQHWGFVISRSEGRR